MMPKWARLPAILAFAAVAAAQDNRLPPRNDALEWAVALSGRYKQLSEQVTSAYGIAALGGVVCPVDQNAGASLYRDALTRLSVLTPQSFTQSTRVLPIPSFTALWKMTVPAAIKCSPDLEQLADAERAAAKMETERRNANSILRRAFSLYDRYPERAAQMAELAITAGDPTTLDIGMLTQFLSELRDRAPDVSDEVFPDALDFICSAKFPITDSLMEFGKHIFVTRQNIDYPDKEQRFESFTVGQTTIVKFQLIRKTANSDDAHDYIESGLKVLTATNDPFYDPVGAYAIAWQMLPFARELAPDYVDKIQEVLNQLGPQIGGSAAQVQSGLNSSQAADPEGGEAAQIRNTMTRRVLAMIGAKTFPEAREMLKSVDDQPVRGQVSVLIDFAESANSLGHNDYQWAFSLANLQRPGVKRSLLYAGLIAAAPNREAALGPFQLAMKDIEALPPELQALTLSALARPMLHADPENGFVALSQLVNALNDIDTRPRRSLFDPKAVRKIYSGQTTVGNDSALILFNRRGLREVIDTGRGRHSFALKVPGVDATTLPAVVRNSAGVDAPRLEATLLGLRSETQLVNALNALAAMRLGKK